MAETKEPKMLKIRQVRSVIGTKRPHREVIKSLGLRHPHDVVERPDTPSVRGMIKKVSYLLEVEEAS